MKRAARHHKTPKPAAPESAAPKWSAAAPSHAPRGSFAGLTLGALGIVYGDIGTSPLYAMDQIFFGRAGGAQTPDDVLGGVSLVIWTITIIVAIKYAHPGAARAERRRGRRLRPLWPAARIQAARHRAGAVVADAGRRAAVRRRLHHAGDQRASRGRGTAAWPRRRSAMPSSRSRIGATDRAVRRSSSRAPPASAVVFGPILLVWFVVIAVLGAAQIVAAVRTSSPRSIRCTGCIPAARRRCTRRC